MISLIAIIIAMIIISSSSSTNMYIYIYIERERYREREGERFIHMLCLILGPHHPAHHPGALSLGILRPREEKRATSSRLCRCTPDAATLPLRSLCM